jgi:Matrixin
MPSRYVAACLALAAVTVTIGVGQIGTDAHGAVAANIPACKLRLPPPSLGSPRFALPEGGRAIARALAGGLQLCRLVRSDGSRFAEARTDRLRQVLEIRFYRQTGGLLFASDAAYPGKASTVGTEVSCGNDGTNTIEGARYWRENIKWRVGKTPSGYPRDDVVDALRAAQSEWANNINWCGADDNANSSSHYDGGSSSLRAGHDGKNVVDWGSLDEVQNCSAALACTANWYDEDGNPVESDVRFSTEVDWSLRPGDDGFDLQSIAAHEFGHMRQFDHVTTGEPSVLMWPYLLEGDTSGRKLGKGDSRGNNANY